MNIKLHSYFEAFFQQPSARKRVITRVIITNGLSCECCSPHPLHALHDVGPNSTPQVRTQQPTCHPLHRHYLSLLLLLGRLELDRNIIHTVTRVRRRGEPFTLELMPQMTTAIGARDFNSLHSHGPIYVSIHSPRDLLIQRRPTAPCIKFGLTGVERGAAGSTHVVALPFCVEFLILVAKRTLGALLPEDVVLFRSQTLLPHLQCGHVGVRTRRRSHHHRNIYHHPSK